MKQNKYDDPAFFAAYRDMQRSREGLEAAGEWPAFRTMLPPFRDKRVLDLGCGFGWHCRYARAEGARSVVGVDLSERMLAQARVLGTDPAVRYENAAIEDLAFPDGSFDVVLSSLALHYVADVRSVCVKVYRWLTPGGAFVFSVEHPIFTARAAQDWHYGADGERLHWPVDDYQHEGLRRTSWLAENVAKYHRTIAGYLNPLLECGFILRRIEEPVPAAETRARDLARDPALKDEWRRPMFLLARADRPEHEHGKYAIAFHGGWAY
ncbi:class I SAM-dependent methyltransferase [Rhodoligotrophos defluvii]|uniref:class I SAM-dependent methyltransferase n=1 Tax=Rhodoligotrophos defluvii TaxID=2561934 RepID=UPI0010C98560|nr:class I SAM-dependent methyltransferase [Rhodoligotrophos defluvii]